MWSLASFVRWNWAVTIYVQFTLINNFNDWWRIFFMNCSFKAWVKLISNGHCYGSMVFLEIRQYVMTPKKFKINILYLHIYYTVIILIWLSPARFPNATSSTRSITSTCSSTNKPISSCSHSFSRHSASLLLYSPSLLFKSVSFSCIIILFREIRKLSLQVTFDPLIFSLKLWGWHCQGPGCCLKNVLVKLPD